ncbi:stress responsive alpha/beta barrel protein [Kribbella sp. VKM Ac-2527]|uniref:Stress responsive alpha/beta barrel protein n=1 Tax=Kribbella caucasensis TaxID=2512215 RepID=A0A4R6KGN5_9ACTN|nr:Dabb family protein [Kribbella sp. VKM Ac-2527]TDO49974.1 stress responsive alpha/beta barrel protein [Kribbella sp. VKM Ac-2527]
MFVNVLRFRFKDGIAVAQQEEVLALMRRTASLDSVAFGVVGQDLGDPADGFTHTYVTAVSDLAALERYMHDPLHLDGDDRMLDYLAKISAVRMSDDLDPDVGKSVYDLHARKAAMYPEWFQQINHLFGAHL